MDIFYTSDGKDGLSDLSNWTRRTAASSRDAAIAHANDMEHAQKLLQSGKSLHVNVSVDAPPRPLQVFMGYEVIQSQ